MPNIFNNTTEASHTVGGTQTSDTMDIDIASIQWITNSYARPKKLKFKDTPQPVRRRSVEEENPDLFI